MDDRVKSMLKIIEVDGDSFSKKAEIYFRKRPELITFVEEAYRAYRALAERYDHISGELHKANHTIATAFPDQVEFDFQDDDDTHLPKAITSIDFSKLNRHKPPPSKVDRGGVSEEVDRIQKEILVLQTEKEFIRSSYENAIARYQEIEDQIESLQDELDDFGESVVIEDDEARTLMATAALRSCEDTLLSLEETQRRSAEFTRIGSRRIMMAKEKLKQIGPDMSLVELAEKINELVNKVITLELTTSSQKAQIESLRMETDELHKQVVGLEEEKLTLIEGSGSSSNISKQAEVESQKIQDVRESENEPEVPLDEKSATVANGESTSHVVEKFRRDIDVLLDENLGFWLRFSTSFQQIQKFQLDFDHLQAAFKRLSDRNTEESSPVDKQLRELKSELQVWLEQNDSLKGESKTRFISLCNIQEEISEALASGLESASVQLSPFQAANFQGEISNMQHENNKVADELQAGVDHVRGLRAQVDKILSEFDEKLELPSSQGSRHHNNPFRIFPSKTHIPLRNFLFGVKSKKKPSIFRCVNPAYQKQYSDLSSGFSS
ncbi:hypothetical protein KSP39_PZI001229 [Platanthera zijinensis]|uniref:NAB domain-containing protein n=1 Tax=Platanthera zijinensis TaxID=2320716 RepID=A0AAP0GFK2_9ASPA